MFNIVEKRKIFFSISLVVIIAGIIAMVAFGGLNADIDFTGGTTVYVDMGTDATENDVRDALKGVKDIKISSIQTAEDNQFIIRLNDVGTDVRDDITAALKESYKDSAVLSVDNVSPTVGSELWGNAAMALIIAIVLMLIYISFRFELLSGLAAIIALAHDMLVMVAVYAIFRINVNTSFIAAMLTILGYSINATIVVFDRIRENSKYMAKETFKNVTNTSIWQTLARSINTSVTTLIMIVVLYIFGVPSIREFALPLMIGIVAGTYSSVFVAGPMWSLIRGEAKEEAKKSKK